MTDVQLYFAIGIPVFAVVMSMVGGIFQMNALGARLTSLEANMNARFTSIENRFTSMEARFDKLAAIPDRH